MDQPKPTTSAPEPAPVGPGLLTGLPLTLRWALLLVASAAVTALLEYMHLPAALLIGAMSAGILFAVNGARMSIPQLPFTAAQAIVGCFIARSVNSDIITTFEADWPLFLALIAAIVLATTIMGYAMARAGTLPGTTALWGTSAGGATAMIVMADGHGGDSRLVAFMQYLRAVSVALLASVVAAYVFGAGNGQTQPADWFAPVDWVNLGLTLAVGLASAALGAVTRFPSGALLMPMIVASFLHATGVLEIELPAWLLGVVYAVIGWRIGLTFTRRILRHALHALPMISASVVVLIAFCAGLAWILTVTLDIDPLTAFLATSPGGLDTVAIIAASTPVDLPFIMALQVMRMALIMVSGPWIARLLAARLPK